MIAPRTRRMISQIYDNHAFYDSRSDIKDKVRGVSDLML
jgi:hypothetical protein